MTQIAVQETLVAELEAVALQDNRSVQAVVDEALSSYLLERAAEPASTDGSTAMPREEVTALLLRRIEQSNRGEVISSEEVDVWFSDLFRELEAR